MKILICEDDGFIGKLYASFFEEQGHDVRWEPEGEQGIYRMREWNPDVVILDILMPKKNGYEVLQDRKEDENLKKIPVVMLTTLSKKEDIQAWIIGGAKMFALYNNPEKSIGTTNIVAAKEKLEELGIPIKTEDTGGTLGRSVSFNIETGLCEVTTKMS